MGGRPGRDAVGSLTVIRVDSSAGAEFLRDAAAMTEDGGRITYIQPNVRSSERSTRICGRYGTTG